MEDCGNEIGKVLVVLISPGVGIVTVDTGVNGDTSLVDATPDDAPNPVGVIWVEGVDAGDVILVEVKPLDSELNKKGLAVLGIKGGPG